MKWTISSFRIKRADLRVFFWKHVWLIFESAVAGGLMILFWLLLFLNKLYLSKEESKQLVNLVIPVLGWVYGILVGFVLHNVMKSYQQVFSFVKAGDRKKLEEELQKRIPVPIHLVTGTISILLVIPLMVLEYGSFREGALVIFSVAYVLYMVMRVATSLDDPTKGPWAIPGIEDMLMKKE